MNIRENAKQHFKGIREGEQGFVEVPEWGEDGKPAIIYFKKAMKLKEQELISNELKNRGDMSAIAFTFVLRALDESGERLFKNVDRVDVMNNFDSKVVLKVVEAMNADENDDLEEATKN